MTYSERAAAGMTASFQRSRRDGQVRGLVFRQGRLACALVIAARINVRVSAQAGAEGLDVVPFRRVIVSDNVLFHLHTHPSCLRSCHPNTPLQCLMPLNQQCFFCEPQHTSLLFTAPLPEDQESLLSAIVISPCLPGKGLM